MAFVTFTGDPSHGGEGPRLMTLYGYDFSAGPVEVTDAAHLAKFAGNSHFSVSEKKPAKAKQDGGAAGDGDAS